MFGGTSVSPSPLVHIAEMQQMLVDLENVRAVIGCKSCACFIKLVAVIISRQVVARKCE